AFRSLEDRRCAPFADAQPLADLGQRQSLLMQRDGLRLAGEAWLGSAAVSRHDHPPQQLPRPPDCPRGTGACLTMEEGVDSPPMVAHEAVESKQKVRQVCSMRLAAVSPDYWGSIGSKMGVWAYRPLDLVCPFKKNQGKVLAPWLFW